MLKIVHALSGVAALVLSLVPSLSGGTPHYLNQPNAVYLALIGLLHLQLIPASTAYRTPSAQLQWIACGLLILAAIAQATILLAPIDQIADQPAALFSLVLTLASVLLQVAGHFVRFPRHKAYAATSPELLNAERETGTVKWFNTSKGFGFISRDSGEDVFVHFRAIRGEGHRVLMEGQRVEFVVMQRDKGLQAEDVIAARV
jgi:CspA family cold shock protein